MLTTKQIDDLESLQATYNQGRGITCVKTIIVYLRRNELEHATSIRRLEGDKTRSYPDVEKMLTELFGCRLHSKQNCTDWLCDKSK